MKVLEEIKHLFDVPGLIFVLGINGDQLAHAIRGVYGPTFEGDKYLSRFINKRYRLAAPDVTPLIRVLLGKLADDQGKFPFPGVKLRGRQREGTISLPQLIASYFKAFEYGARQAYQVTEAIKLCAGLTGAVPLLLPFLLPMILNRLRGCTLTEPMPRDISDWQFVLTNSNIPFTQKRRFEDMGAQQLFHSWNNISYLSLDDISTQEQQGDLVATYIWYSMPSPSILSDPKLNLNSYIRLVDTVGAILPD